MPKPKDEKSVCQKGRSSHIPRVMVIPTTGRFFSEGWEEKEESTFLLYS